MRYFFSRFALLLVLACCFDAFADAPREWQFGFQEPVTDLMETVVSSHNHVMWIMGGVAVAVWIVMAYVIVRFRRRDIEPKNSKTASSGHLLLEIIWTVVPLILVGIFTVSNVTLIKRQEKIPEVDMTLKVIGYQWYWGYSYPDYDDLSFDSYMKQDDELKKGDLRLLEVDNRVVLPINTNIRIQITAADVIHSFAVPAFGIKIDAIPGRLNEAWFNIRKPGVYYGQCSELCGRLHGFMPIVVEAVTKEDFQKWLKTNKA